MALFASRARVSELRVATKIGIRSSVSTTMRGTMIYMALTTTSWLDVILR
jgi:hypothetical protein